MFGEIINVFFFQMYKFCVYVFACVFFIFFCVCVGCVFCVCVFVFACVVVCVCVFVKKVSDGAQLGFPDPRTLDN